MAIDLTELTEGLESIESQLDEPFTIDDIQALRNLERVLGKAETLVRRLRNADFSNNEMLQRVTTNRQRINRLINEFDR